MATSSDTIDTENNEEEDFPFVFQCRECNSIIGDSYWGMCANRDLQTVSLDIVREGSTITNSEDHLETSTGDHDFGSTSVALKCTTCKTSLGRIYKTTPKELDKLRDTFTLDLAKIKCYQLGCNKENRITDINEMVESPTTKSLQDEILKLKVFVVAMNERLQTVEDHLAEHVGKETGTENCNDKQTAHARDRRTKRKFSDTKQNINNMDIRAEKTLKRKKT